VALVAAGFLSVIWLIVAAVTGYELGILAWAMGGAIGLIAGVIGRNPSPVYCGLVAGVAVVSVLGAKVIMALVIVAMSWGAEFMIDMQDMSPERQRLFHAMADQLLEEEQFDGIERELVQLKVDSFFSGSHDLYTEMTEEMYEVSADVDERIRSELEAKSAEEQQAILEAARTRHPEWIEDENHYLAVIDQMLKEPETLSEDLAAHARSELAVLDESWDEEYYDTAAPAEIRRRRMELRKLAAERIHALEPQQRDEAVREALQEHPSWIPFPDARTAMIEKMQREGAFTGPLAEHAQAALAYEMEDDFPEYYDTVPEDTIAARDKQLNATVSQELVALDAASRDALVADMKQRHPDWYGQEQEMEDAQQELEDALNEIGSDGTFWGSFRAVFGIFDLLWLFLGATTAFGTAHKYGMKP
jgi:hypothetical protein